MVQPFVSAGGAYWVGEKGPEIFNPNRSGNIQSNKQSMAAPAAPAPAEITIVNVWSTDDVLDTMGSSEGKRIILNQSPGKGQQ